MVTKTDLEALVAYAETADISGDPLVVDLVDAVRDLTHRILKAQGWADENKEFFQRPMHWELERILAGGDEELMSEPPRSVSSRG